jgi:phytoene dehydrogenase-like protein
MSSSRDYDAVVVGAGPNGLAAAITLARAGCSVLVLEANETIGGGSRTKALTLPGFLHDVCSAIHPLGIASPFFDSLPLDQFGLEWIQPDAPLTHPFEDGSAAVLERSLDDTVRSLPNGGGGYRRLMAPLVHNWQKILPQLLGPLPIPPRHPFLMARFGFRAIQSAQGLALRSLESEPARGLFAGLSGHSMLPLDRPVTSGFGLMLGILGHVVGWPLPKGGSQKIVDAMAGYLTSLGGEIVTGFHVQHLDELPSSRAVLLDVTPQQLLCIAGDRLPAGYRSRLERYRYGPGIFKIDYALDAPVPWASSACSRSATVHVGGSLDQIAAAEKAVWGGEHPERPFLLVAQPSLFDASRAPKGQHTLWVYCHVPHGSTFDMTDRIDDQIERFAPGFRERILARHTFNSAEMQAYNPNYIGGDINGGVQDLSQFFTRPVASLDPYATPVPGLFLCSSSTPPGGGVHGMCGYHAAQSALKRAL